MPEPIRIIQPNPKASTTLFLHIKSYPGAFRQLHSCLPQYSSALIAQVNNNGLFLQRYHLGT